MRSMGAEQLELSFKSTEGETETRGDVDGAADLLYSLTLIDRDARRTATPPAEGLDSELRIEETMGSAMIQTAQQTQQRADHKERGAYYTPRDVAEFLVAWAVRSPTDSVLDPSFGGGVFLNAAVERIRATGGDPANQVFGVEINPASHRAVTRALTAKYHIPRAHMRRIDFFELGPDELQVEAVVGNPPFIRYQRFAGAERRRALSCAAAEGVQLSRLSSSWAPFVVHGISKLKEGGRLAMVLPFELTCATYARPVLEHLARSFRSVTFLTFDAKLFPDLSEETILLLADGKGEAGTRFAWRNFRTVKELNTAFRLDASPPRISGSRRLMHGRLCTGDMRLIECFLSRPAHGLYQRLKTAPLFEKLGDFAEVGIGYVTGANSFFHLSPNEAAIWGIPQQFLFPAAYRGGSLHSLLFTEEDWRQGLDAEQTGYLFKVNGTSRLPSSVLAYIRTGENGGVHRAYKCRVRDPWYSVPHVHVPDGVLTYMSGSQPRMVANAARCVVPNTLHAVRLRDSSGISAQELALLWQNSLTRLSAEIEGHALGGGMLKIEPREARRILIPRPSLPSREIRKLADRADALVRDGREGEAMDLVDQVVLIGAIGLSERECLVLRKAADGLRARRCGRRHGGER